MLIKIIVIIGLLTACEWRKAGKENFIPLVRQYDLDSESSYSENLIIGRVQKEELHINYEGVTVQEFKNLSRAVEGGLKVWLSALSAEENVVDIFKHTMNEHDVSNSIYDLTISKDCGLSYSYRAHYSLSFREVCMRRTNSFAVLLHELGHAFGLGDTYIPRAEHRGFKYSKSDDNDSDNVGKQPKSIMCCAESIDIGHWSRTGLFWATHRALPMDDADGIRYVYSQAFKGETRACPDYYTYEENTEGCLPTSIAIIRSGDVAPKGGGGKVLADNNYKFDTEEVDEQGNTTLHHAAMIIKNHSDLTYYKVSEIIKDRHGKGRGESLADYLQKHNQAGETPLDIYQYLKSDVNRDGEINDLDLELISPQMGKSFNSSNCYPYKRYWDLSEECFAVIAADVSGDDKVDANDLEVARGFMQ